MPVAALCAAVAGSLAVTPALAQDTAPRAADEPAAASAGYVNPFPEGDTYKVQVYGDGFAEGLLSGLIDAFGNDPRVSISSASTARP